MVDGGEFDADKAYKVSGRAGAGGRLPRSAGKGLVGYGIKTGAVNGGDGKGWGAALWEKLCWAIH
jgi:hypothetical protein